MGSRRIAVMLVGTATVVAMLPGPVATADPGSAPGPAGSYLLTATGTGSDYAPTFTGNGYLGVRVPPAGQGYAGGAVPAQSEVAGFYAQPAGTGAKAVQQRANLPSWSGLALAVDGHP